MVLSLEDCSHRLGGDAWFSHWRVVPTGWVVMVLSLEGCSHRKSITNTQKKVPNKIALCARDIHGDAFLCSIFNFVNH